MSEESISIADCRRMVESGQPMRIIDVRTPAEFARVHAVGARLLPLDHLDPPNIAGEKRDDNAPVYLICQSGGRAATARQRLVGAGVSGVYCIEGGTAAWEKAGLPVERSGGKVISIERQVRIGAGSLVVMGAVLAWTIHPAFLALSAAVGAGLIYAGVTDYCGMAIVLGKMPWNG